METEITDIGKVAITPRKDYKNEQTYEWLDVVTYDGAGYMCIAEDGCTGIVPTNTDCWQLLADKGHFTEEDKEEFKKAVVEESKTEINEHTGNKKTELNNYTTELEKSLENELDKYKTEKEAEMDLHKATLETEMANKKDSLIEEIETAQDGFDANVEEKTNTFNSNVETKTTEFNNNSNAKTEEFNNNSTEKINAFNYNAEEKIAEYDAHTEKLTNRIADLEEENSELAQQMPWNTTEISESIHIEDSAKYSRNKLDIFGNMKQDTREGYNFLKTENFIFTNGTLEQNGLTATIKSDGSIVINGTATATTYLKTDIKNILEDGNYYFYNFNNVTQSAATYYMLVQGNKSTGYESTDYYNMRGYQTDNFVKDTTVYNRTFNCMFVFTNGFVANNLILYPVISKSAQTAYEQYGAMPSFKYPSMPIVATGLQTVNVTHNVLPLDVDKWETGTIDGKSGEPKPSQTRIRMKEYAKIENNTIYVAGLINDIKALAIRIYDENYNYIDAGYDYNFLHKFNTPANAKYYKCILKNKNSTVITNSYIKEAKPILYKEKDVKKIKLNLDTTELCKITDSDGNVVAQDRPVYRETDEIWKWQWEKKVLKAVINSKTEIKYNGLKNNNTAVDFLSQTLKNLPANVFSPIIEKITRYNYLKPNSTSSVNFRITVSLANLEIEKFTTPENAVKALKNLITKKGDAIIYYKATEPIYEDCTVDQSEALEKLYKMQLEKGVNNIFVESENGVTTELQLEYMQDNNLKKEQKNKALEDRITAIENLLSTTETSALLLDNMQNDLESEVK